MALKVYSSFISLLTKYLLMGQALLDIHPEALTHIRLARTRHTVWLRIITLGLWGEGWEAIGENIIDEVKLAQHPCLSHQMIMSSVAPFSEHLSFAISLYLHFLCVSHKNVNYINIYAFLLLICLISIEFSALAGNPKWVEVLPLRQ